MNESAVPPLRSGDEIVQLNNRRVRDCAELTAALAEARERGVDGLLLVRRAGREESLIVRLPPVSPEPAQPAAPIATPYAAGPEPTLRPPAPRGAADAELVRETARQFADFGRDLEARLPLVTAHPWVKRIGDLQTEYLREKSRTPAVAAVDDVAAAFATLSEILLYKEAAAGRGGRRTMRPDLTFEFASNSPVAGWLKRHPFLRASVVKEPQSFSVLPGAERAGFWMPDEAIRLLVEHAVAEATRLERAPVGG